MKKRVDKHSKPPGAKSVVKKDDAARKELPRRAAEASMDASRDPLRSLLKGAHTHRVCDR